MRAAERRLAADTARIGVATADLYPQISLGGSIGSTGAQLGDLFSGGPLRWLLGPLINWTSSTRTPARARDRRRRGRHAGALADFDGTRAARAGGNRDRAVELCPRARPPHALQAARDEAATAARITRAHQREGQIDFLDVLDAERTLADTEADLAAADARIADAQVDLFRALGGGWQAPSRPAA